jgi:methionyl-tRNA formyltransferase
MIAFEKLRIIFFGTPDFAVASLDALVQTGANVVAVVTAPDKPAGRGMQLKGSAVKEYAVSKNITALQPEKLKDAAFIEELRSLGADLQVVVAFRMLPEIVWNMPKMGTINVHASLLPQYRGAAPINWAIINGEQETGVTTFKLQHAIDTGDILLQQKVPITDDDNAGSLHDKLMAAGAGLLVATVKGLADGTLQEMPQTASPELRHAPKIFKEDTRINWQRPVGEIQNFIRGMSPHPAAFAMLGSTMIKVYRSHFEIEAHDKYGNAILGYQYTDVIYETDGKSYLRFAGPDGWVYIDELQQEGKKRMGVVEFLRGYRG